MSNIHFENRKISKNFFVLVWSMYAIVYMTKSCFSAAMASIVSEGTMTKSQTGFITSMFFLVYAPLQIVGGIFADRYDPHKLIKIGLLGGSIANLIVFLNQNYYMVLVTWICNAIFQFALWPSVFKIISSQIVSEDRRNSAYFISFSPTAGLLLAYLVAAILPKWQYNFALSSAILFMLTVIWHIVSNRIKKYLVPASIPETTVLSEVVTSKKVSTVKLFFESGFFILLIVAFMGKVVLNSINTLSSTMLMESYDGVPPWLGNCFNMIIIAVGILGTVIVKSVLYPKHIKSAPTGILIMFCLALISSVVLLFVGSVNLFIMVVVLCLTSGFLVATELFNSYCNLRFAKFGKSATASGVMNMATSFGVVVNSYGVAKVAESYDWQTVTKLFFVLIVVAIILSIAVLPLWKKFKKKYHAHTT